MGIYDYTSPTGRRIQFNIKGDAPSQTEMARINAFVSGAPAPEEAPQPDQKVQEEPGIAGALYESIIGPMVDQFQGGMDYAGQYIAEQSPTHTFLGSSASQWEQSANQQNDEARQEGRWMPTKDFTDEEGFYNKARNLAYQAGPSIPSTIGAIGGGLIGASIGGWAGGIGAVPGFMAGAAIGSSALSFPYLFNENAQAQVQQHGKVKDWGKVWVATGANAAIEGASDAVVSTIPLGPALKKAFSPVLKQAAKEAGESVFKELVKKTGAAAAGGAVTGAMEEALQQAVTRWNAEQPLGDAEAQKDYLENAIVGGLLQGIFGGALAPIGVHADVNERNALRDAWKDAELESKQKTDLHNAASNVENKAPPPPDPQFMRLEDHSGPTQVQLALEKPETKIPASVKLTDDLPVKTQKARAVPTEEEYAQAVNLMRDEKSFSPHKIRTAMGIHDTPARMLFDMMKERGDAFSTGSEGQYLKIKRGESGVQAPDRKYRSGPVDIESQTPYTILRPDGRRVGGEFKTQEEAQRWAIDNRVSEHIPNYEIKKNDTAGQYAVYEDSYAKKKDVSGVESVEKVGTRVVKVYPDAKSANEAVREYDPNFSPETHAAQEAEAEAIKREEIKKQVEGPLQAAIDSMMGADRTHVSVEDFADRNQMKAKYGVDTKNNIIEGVTLRNPDDKMKSTIVALRKMLDKNATDEDLKGLVLGHEFIHSAINAGLLTKPELNRLIDLARTMKVPGKSYTFLQKQNARQGGQLEMRNGRPDINGFFEEGVAEMARAYVRNPSAFDKKNRPVIQKIVDFIKKFLNLAGSDGRDLLDAIYNRNILAEREVGSGYIRNADDVFFSSIKIPGFYMKSAKVIENAKQEKASPDQWMGILKNSGVKEDELEWLGIEDALKNFGEKSIHKRDVLNYIAANSLEVEETINQDTSELVRKREQARENIREKFYGGDQSIPEMYADHIQEEYAGAEPYSNYDINWFNNTFPDDPLSAQYRKSLDDWQSSSDAEYKDAVQRGGENYREFLIHLPSEKNKLSPGREFSAHYTTPNIIGTARTTDRTIEGRKVLFIEEVQSDWHQKGARKGYGKWVPDAPLKSSWDALMMKRLIRFAAENDYDNISWHGEMDSVAMTESYHNWEQEDTPEGPKYWLKTPDEERVTNLTSIVNRYLAPNGLRSVTKGLGKKYGAVPYLYDPKANVRTAADNSPLDYAFFNTVGDIHSFSPKGGLPSAVSKKLNVLEQLFYNRNGTEWIDDEEAIKLQEKAGLTQSDLNYIYDPNAGGMIPADQGPIQDDAQGNPLVKRWMMDMTKELKEAALGEGFPMFSKVTESSKFTEWFAGSKVTDKDGQPMIMYHGTSKDVDFKKFKAGRRGIWFTNSASEASSYAKENDSRGFKRDGWDIVRTNERDRVIPVFLDIKNPYEFTEEDRKTYYKQTNYAKWQADFFDRLKMRGYDGVDMGGGVWVAFQPNQIKSVFNTEFSSQDPRFSKITDNDQFRKWFGDSKIIDPVTKAPLIVYHGTNKIFDRFGRVQTVDHGWYGPGFYFTPEFRSAGAYAEDEYYNDINEVTPGARIIPAYISMKNPFMFQGAPLLTKEESEAFGKRVKALGHDGVIYASIDEDGDIWPIEVVAFEPHQIKSIWNQQFDPYDPAYSRVSAFHGSPHTYDKVDHGRMGTGSGAQIYGWGTYLSDIEDYANRYRIENTQIQYNLPADLAHKVEIPYAVMVRPGHNSFAVAYDVSKSINAPERVQRLVSNIINERMRFPEKSWKDAFKDIRSYYHLDFNDDQFAQAEDIIRKIDPRFVQSKGSMYRMNIPGHQELMMWDEHFYAQPPLVQAALRNAGFSPDEESYGHRIYSDLVHKLSTKKAASLHLRDIGIPGHRYIMDKLKDIYDPAQKFNYVIFDEDQIEIEARYSATAPAGQRVPNEPSEDMLRRVEQQMTYDNVARRLNQLISKTPFVSEYYKHKAKHTVDSGVINLQDRMLPLARLIDQLRANGGFISNETDTYLQDTLFSGKTEFALEEAEKNLYAPMAKAIKALNVSKEEALDASHINQAANDIFRIYVDKNIALAEMYVYAQHAIERNAIMRERNLMVDDRDQQMMHGSGMTDEEATEILDWVNTSRFRNALSDLSNKNSIRSLTRNIVRSTNVTRISSGLTPDFDLMEPTNVAGKQTQTYLDYVPLRNFLEEAPDADRDLIEFVRSGKGYKIAGNEDMSALGRRSLASNVIAHAIMQNMEAQVRAKKNDVSMSFINLVRNNAEAMKDVAEVVDIVPMKFALDRKTGTVRRIHNANYVKAPDILVGKEDGKEVLLRIKDPKLARALLTKPAMGSGVMEAAGNGLLKINRALAAVRTAYNPDFMVSNFLRDLQTAFLNMSELELDNLRADVKNSIWDALKGAQEGIRSGTANTEWGKAYVDFRRYGGKTAHMGRKELSDVIKEMNKHLQDGGNLSSVMKGLKKFGKFVEDYNSVIENGVRLATFKHLQDRFTKGMTDPAAIRRGSERAAFISKNLTVNFNAGGELKPLMNALYLFYNASIQGSVALVNSMSRSSKVRKIWASVILAGVLQDLLMSMISPEDADGENAYDKIDDYILENNMIFMDPFGMTKKGYLAIPMPYLMNGIWGIGRNIGRTMRGKQSPMEGAANTVSVLANSLNPFGAANSFLNWVSPTVVDPIVDLALNRDAFGKPIMPEGSPFGLNPRASERYWNNTSGLYRFPAQFMSFISGGQGEYLPGLIEWSPNQIEYVFGFAGGSAATFAQRTLDLTPVGQNNLIRLMSGDKDVGFNDIPILRKFAGNVSSRNDMEYYLKHRDEVLSVRKELQEAAKAGDSGHYQEIMQKYPVEYRISAQINSLESQRRKLSRALKKVRESNQLTDAQKAEREKTIKNQQDELIGKANRLLREI